VPAVPLLGIYPTWETLVPQLVLLAAGVAALIFFRVRDRRAMATAQAA
jgi:high-affinity Fe2+/Pb2+ permease